jgi:hypothetical protein
MHLRSATSSSPSASRPCRRVSRPQAPAATGAARYETGDGEPMPSGVSPTNSISASLGNPQLRTPCARCRTGACLHHSARAADALTLAQYLLPGLAATPDHPVGLSAGRPGPVAAGYTATHDATVHWSSYPLDMGRSFFRWATRAMECLSPMSIAPILCIHFVYRCPDAHPVRETPVAGPRPTAADSDQAVAAGSRCAGAVGTRRSCN